MTKSLEVLNEIRIASPCTVSWRSMKGDELVRHCSHCDRKVFNLSQMSSTAAAQLLEEHGHDLCVRLYKRHDGTVMTQDCGAPFGNRWRVAAWAASLVASLFAMGCGKATTGCDNNATPVVEGHLMGAIMPPKDWHASQKPTTQPATQPSEPDGAAAK